MSLENSERASKPEGLLKARYKSESSLMTCEDELHGRVTIKAHPMVSHKNNLTRTKVPGQLVNNESPGQNVSSRLGAELVCIT